MLLSLIQNYGNEKEQLFIEYSAHFLSWKIDAEYWLRTVRKADLLLYHGMILYGERQIWYADFQILFKIKIESFVLDLEK